MVFVAQLIELMMTCILYVLLCGELMVGIFPGTSLTLSAWIIVCAAPLLPCAFLRSLCQAAWLSFWCTVAHMFINSIILIYCFTRTADWQWDAVQVKIDIRAFPISLGIVVFSYTSQVFLPSLEGNLIEVRHHDALDTTGGCDIQGSLLLHRVRHIWNGHERGDHRKNQTMKAITNVFLVAKALLSYPLPYFANLIESKFYRGQPETTFPACFVATGPLKMWALLLRLGLVGFTMVLQSWCRTSPFMWASIA